MIYVFQQNPALAVSMLFGFVVGVVLHEAAHAFSAYGLGDDTPYRMGRITLNPAAHLDVTGVVMFALVGFGWGKTPITPSKLRGGIWGPVAVALAGPVANLIVLAVCAVLFQLPFLQAEYLGTLLFGVAFINALLFVFNLIPIPPLDGASILYPFLPRSLDGFVAFMYEYGPYVLLGLILVSILIPGFSPFAFIQSVVLPLLDVFGLV